MSTTSTYLTTDIFCIWQHGRAFGGTVHTIINPSMIQCICSLCFPNITDQLYNMCSCRIILAVVCPNEIVMLLLACHMELDRYQFVTSGRFPTIIICLVVASSTEPHQAARTIATTSDPAHRNIKSGGE